jgi:hypothetical protein
MSSVSQIDSPQQATPALLYIVARFKRPNDIAEKSKTSLWYELI